MKAKEVAQHLRQNFAQGVVNENIFRDEVTLEIHKAKLIEILKMLKQAQEPGFEVLTDLTGIDYLVPEKRTKVVYGLQNPTNYERLRLYVFAGRGETLPSVTKLWAGANWYERELFDLFGIRFKGHPDLKRILMPDEWKGHPLLKDYALTEEAVEFKHGVQPKVPSEIIPGVRRNHLNTFGTYVKSHENP